MNRQVGPSIVLSVMIVGFFAVALFQHDTPRAIPKQKPAALGGIINGGRAKTTIATNASPPRPTRSNTSPVTVVSAAKRRAKRADSDRTADGEVVTSLSASLSLTTARSAERLEVARRPRSSFTVVGSDETIADVSMRVYGTTKEVDSLWEANRDSLPLKDSPISAGMLLRTPRVR